MAAAILQILLLLGIPWAAQRLARRALLPGWLSPVVLCYTIGILASNTKLLPLNDAWSTHATEAGILMGIPLLLYSTRLRALFAHARPALLSFGLCALSGVTASSLAAWHFASQLPESWQLAGMLTGIYTGGTPNMQAIGLALQAPRETIILVNAADVLLGGIYLLLLSSFLPVLLGKILPAFAYQSDGAEGQTDPVPPAMDYRDAGIAVAFTLLIIGAAAGLTFLLFGHLQEIAFLMLALTSLSLLATAWGRVRSWKSTFETGEYFLLVFCVGLGMLADFRDIMANGGPIIAFSAFAMFGTILLHLLLSRLFRIDRDTFLFTSVAALYGPPFIGQLASITGNRQLMLTGIALGLLGYAIGNYLGISLAYLLQALLVG
ncbi:DUF819 family protein [Phaeodactylibacter luteus]|uniref:DUF819 family protein n=1 Tax=Phaeodactylibacter luteus TaxID=1564516 RepID=A0A5C6S7C5_9BACT|nr:DUF819 family protein [Phaeodactylibacter luteus]TXB70253.1 DUF819 family protein [Phaeodactylibacter luteus]